MVLLKWDQKGSGIGWALTQYKGAAEVCKYLLKYNASERISAQDFLARIVTVLPIK